MSPPAEATTITLSEAASKALLAPFGVVFPDERTVPDPSAAVAAADEIGYPVAAKLNGDRIAHKTERGLVRLGLADAAAIRRAAEELLEAATPDDGDVDLLVAPMIRSNREFIVGASTDEQFGPVVMLGLGGVLAEAVDDAAVRLAPIGTADAHDLIDDLRTQELLGAFRGEPAVDRDALASLLVAVGAAITERSEVRAVDLNPVLVRDGLPVAVDALVEVER